MTNYSFFSINEIWVTTNVLGDGNGAMSDYNRNFHFLSVISLLEVDFLGPHIVAMLENIVR